MLCEGLQWPTAIFRRTGAAISIAPRGVAPPTAWHTATQSAAGRHSQEDSEAHDGGEALHDPRQREASTDGRTDRD